MSELLANFQLTGRKLKPLVLKQLEKNFYKYNHLKDFNLKRIITKELVDEITGHDNSVEEIAEFYQQYSGEILYCVENKFIYLINKIDVSPFQNDFEKVWLSGFVKYYTDYCKNNNLTKEQSLEIKPRIFFNYFNKIVHLIFMKNIRKSPTIAKSIYINCFEEFVRKNFKEEYQVKRLIKSSGTYFKEFRIDKNKLLKLEKKRAKRPFLEHKNQYLDLMTK